MLKSKNFWEARAAFERDYIVGELIKTKGNILLTAKHLEIDRCYLHRMIRKHKLKSFIDGLRYDAKK